jgi:hypothetical protein
MVGSWAVASEGCPAPPTGDPHVPAGRRLILRNPRVFHVERDLQTGRSWQRRPSPRHGSRQELRAYRRELRPLPIRSAGRAPGRRSVPPVRSVPCATQIARPGRAHPVTDGPSVRPAGHRGVVPRRTSPIGPRGGGQVAAPRPLRSPLGMGGIVAPPVVGARCGPPLRRPWRAHPAARDRDVCGSAPPREHRQPLGWGYRWDPASEPRSGSSVRRESRDDRRH